MNINDFLKIKKYPRSKKDKIIVFSIVANEIYLLPYFLKHYRSLGIKTFFFLIDKSDDGTIEFLEKQEDCGLLTTDIEYNQKIKFSMPGVFQNRISRGTNFLKFVVPHSLFKNHWVLTADADEFIELPIEFGTFINLIECLEKNKLTACRSFMIDMFPEKLSSLNPVKNRHPSEVCNFYNRPVYTWPDGHLKPTFYDFSNEIRAQMNNNFLSSRKGINDKKYLTIDDKLILRPRMFKTVLNYWSNKTYSEAHVSNGIQSNKIMTGFRHYHFHDKLQDKINHALENKQYFNMSSNYLVLDFMLKYLSEVPLKSKNTLSYSEKNFQDSGVIYNFL